MRKTLPHRWSPTVGHPFQPMQCMLKRASNAKDEQRKEKEIHTNKKQQNNAHPPFMASSLDIPLLAFHASHLARASNCTAQGCPPCTSPTVACLYKAYVSNFCALLTSSISHPIQHSNTTQKSATHKKDSLSSPLSPFGGDFLQTCGLSINTSKALLANRPTHTHTHPRGRGKGREETYATK